MLRSKYLAGNLKREKERTIPRYLESFLSHVRDPRPGISQQNDSVNEGNATEGSARAREEPARKEAADRKIKESNKKARGTENPVAIRLAPLDQPGTSKSPRSGKKASWKGGQGKAKSTRSKATQMRQNSSTQRLQDDEDIDDDSSMADDAEGRQKYILVGWDNFRSKLMVILLVLLVLWAIIYFPLIGT